MNVAWIPITQRDRRRLLCNEPSIFIEVWEFLDKVSVSAFQEGLCFVEVAEENNSIAARKNVTPDRYN